jgi:hypothetical protein
VRFIEVYWFGGRAALGENGRDREGGPASQQRSAIDEKRARLAFFFGHEASSVGSVDGTVGAAEPGTDSKIESSRHRSGSFEAKSLISTGR